MTDKLTIWTYDWVPPGPRGFDRVTAGPAFLKAHADQMAHFAAADEKRAQGLTR